MSNLNAICEPQKKLMSSCMNLYGGFMRVYFLLCFLLLLTMTAQSQAQTDGNVLAALPSEPRESLDFELGDGVPIGYTSKELLDSPELRSQFFDVRYQVTNYGPETKYYLLQNRISTVLGAEKVLEAGSRSLVSRILFLDEKKSALVFNVDSLESYIVDYNTLTPKFENCGGG